MILSMGYNLMENSINIRIDIKHFKKSKDIILFTKEYNFVLRRTNHFTNFAGEKANSKRT